MPEVRITHIGGPTTLIEIDGLRLLTDPTFDAPGRRYSFGWGSASHKTTGPAVAAADLPPIDAVLLSHDHHGDNLDDAGRALLPSVGVVFTTVPGARRLGGNARGLAPWTTTRLEAPSKPPIQVTATPCRHGPPLSYEGWTHFRQGRTAIEREFATAPEDIRRSIRWLPIGEATTVAA